MDAVTVYFPVKTLTPLSVGSTDEPTYKTIKLARDQLNGNAASIPSLRGGGIHGHLVLTLTDAEYLQVANNVAFVAPVHPDPLTYTANATGPQQIEQARLYKLNLESFGSSTPSIRPCGISCWRPPIRLIFRPSSILSLVSGR
eukprot:scaffold70121_cov55-Attheya_sp.AAC.4